jgi:hypothetical protein
MISALRTTLRTAPVAASVSVLVVLALLGSQPPATAQTADTASDQPKPLTLAVNGPSVRAEGVSPGARVAWFGITRASNGQVPTLTRFEEIVADEDFDGVVELETGEVPDRSVWVAVELGNGALGVLAPNRAVVREIAPPTDNLRAGPGARLDRVADRRPYAELVLVRPSAGAWGLSAGKGTDADEAAPETDGFVAALTSFRPIGDTAGEPGEVAHGDILVAVDRHTLEFYAVRLVR